MAHGIPVGMPLGVQGGSDAWPASLDPTQNYPRMIFSVLAVGTFPVASGCYVEVTGAFGAGFTFQPEGPQGPSVPLLPTACFPAPKDGKLIVNAVGSGTPIIIVWHPAVGERIMAGRGMAPAGSIIGSLSPKASPNSFVAGGLQTPAIAGTAIIGPVTVPTAGVVITDNGNANPIFFAETQAKAALLGGAGGGTPLYPVGADVFPIPAGGSLFAASVSGTELCYVRSEVG